MGVDRGFIGIWTAETRRRRRRRSSRERRWVSRFDVLQRKIPTPSTSSYSIPIHSLKSSLPDEAAYLPHPQRLRKNRPTLPSLHPPHSLPPLFRGLVGPQYPSPIMSGTIADRIKSIEEEMVRSSLPWSSAVVIWSSGARDSARGLKRRVGG